MDLIQPVKKTPISRARAQEEAPGWHAQMLNLGKVHQKYTGNGIKIAVLDTGIYKHPDLKNLYNEAELNNRLFNYVELDHKDGNGHGTHVAGIAMADSYNSTGILAVAPDAEIVVIKVLDKHGSGYNQAVIDGIDMAIAQKVNIINCSLGGAYDPNVEAACKRAKDAGVVMICAAGNEGWMSSVLWPAASQHTVSVGSIGQQLKISDFSNNKEHADIHAPGEEIMSTVLRGRYEAWNGTSMATPIVSGILALAMEKWGTQTPDIWFNALKNDLSVVYTTNGYSYNLVDTATLTLEEEHPQNLGCSKDVVKISAFFLSLLLIYFFT